MDEGAKDLPSVDQSIEPKTRNLLQRLVEEVRRLQRGAITETRAKKIGLLNSDGIPAAQSDTLDLTKPSAPTGLTLTAGVSSIILMWGAPTYTAGGGHGQTNIYAVKRDPASTAAAPTFGDAARVDVADGAVTVHSLPSEFNTRWYVWVTFQSKAGVESDPAGGINGVTGVTSQDVSQMLAALSQQITSSQLASSLATPIALINAADTVANSPAWRVKQEADARVAAIAAEVTNRQNAVQAESISRGQAISNVDTAIRADLATADQAVMTTLRSEQTTAHATTLASAQNYTYSKAQSDSALSGLGTTLTAALTLADASILASAQSFTYSRALIDSADAANLATVRSEFASADGATLASAQNYTYSKATIDNAVATSSSTLRAQLTGGYAGSDINALSSGLLHQERQTRASETAALSQQITLLSAGAGEQFDYKSIWYFDAGIEGWSTNGSGSSLTAEAGWLVLKSASGTLADRGFYSPDNLGVDGAKYPQVRLRLRKYGTPTWEGMLFFITTADAAYNTTKSLTIAEPSFDANGISVVTFDMPAAWTGATIKQIRLDASTSITPTDYFTMDWAAIGRPSPGASSAQLTNEEIARQNADSALASDITALSASLTSTNNTVTTKADASALTALTTRVTNAEGVNTSQGESITSLNNSVSTINGALSGKASAAALDSLTTTVTSQGGTLTSQGNRVTSLENTVNNVTTGVTATANALDVVELLVNDGAKGNNALATKTTNLQAKIDGVDKNAFSAIKAWNLKGSLDGWGGYYGGVYGTLTAGANAAVLQTVQLSPTSHIGIIAADFTAFSGNLAPIVRARVSKPTNNAPWYGQLFYQVAGGHGEDGGYTCWASEPDWGSDGWGVAEWDMATNSTVPSDWLGSSINRLRLDIIYTSTTASQTQIDWIAAGSYQPSASFAQLQSTESALVTADTANAIAIATVSARLNGGGDVAQSIVQVVTTASADATSKADAAQAAATAVANTAQDRADSAYGLAETSAGQITTIQSRIDGAVGGEALNADPYCRVPSEWGYGGHGDNVTDFVTINDGTAGLYAMRAPNGSPRSADGLRGVPVIAGRKYQISALVRKTDATNNSVFYLRYVRKSATDVSISQHVLTGSTEGVSVSTTWSLVSGTFVATADDKLVAPRVIMNWVGNQVGAHEVQAVILKDITDVDGLVASVQTEASTRASQTGDLFAQNTVKITVGGLISGYGLASTAANATPTSAFGIQAGSFFVGPPAVSQSTAPTANLFKGFVWYDTSTSTTKYYTGSAWSTTPQGFPVYVQTTPTTINGVSVAPGLYVTDAFIANGTISNAKIGNLAVDDAKISSLSVAKLIAGSMQVGAYVRSTTYTGGSAGFTIEASGYAEFNNVVVRGTVIASAGAIGGFYIGADHIKSTNWVQGVTGIRLNDNGTAWLGGWNMYGAGMRSANYSANTAGIELDGATGAIKAYSNGGANVINTGATGTQSLIKAGAGIDIKANGDVQMDGKIRSQDGRKIIDSKATGSQDFIAVYDQYNVKKVSITADGEATFAKTIASGVWDQGQGSGVGVGVLTLMESVANALDRLGECQFVARRVADYNSGANYPAGTLISWQNVRDNNGNELSGYSSNAYHYIIGGVAYINTGVSVPWVTIANRSYSARVLANRSTIDYSSGSPPAEKSTLWVDFNIDASVVMPNRHYNTEGAGQYDNSNYPIVIKVIIIPKFVNNATYPTAIHMNRIDWELDYIP